MNMQVSGETRQRRCWRTSSLTHGVTGHQSGGVDANGVSGVRFCLPKDKTTSRKSRDTSGLSDVDRGWLVFVAGVGGQIAHCLQESVSNE